MATLCGDFKEQDKICHAADTHTHTPLQTQENKNHFQEMKKKKSRIIQHVKCIQIIQHLNHSVSYPKQLKFKVCAMKLYKCFLLKAGENKCTTLLFSFLSYFAL